MFAGTVATGGIPVDLNTLAVRIVREKGKIKLKCIEPRALEGQSVGSSVGRGGILGDGSWCCSCQDCRGRVPRSI